MPELEDLYSWAKLRFEAIFLVKMGKHDVSMSKGCNIHLGSE